MDEFVAVGLGKVYAGRNRTCAKRLEENLRHEWVKWDGLRGERLSTGQVGEGEGGF